MPCRAGIAATNPKPGRPGDVASRGQVEPAVHPRHLRGGLAIHLDQASPHVDARQPEKPLHDPRRVPRDLGLHHELFAAADLDRVGNHLDPHEARLRQIPPRLVDPREHERKLVGRPGGEQSADQGHHRRREHGRAKPTIPHRRERQGLRRHAFGRRHQLGKQLTPHTRRRSGTVCQRLRGDHRLRQIDAAGLLEQVGELPPVGPRGPKPDHE